MKLMGVVDLAMGKKHFLNVFFPWKCDRIPIIL